MLIWKQNNQNYDLAIKSFQSALKNSMDDFHSWIGLGEAYASSGRYTAALKVFTKAIALDGKNWFAKYMLANVNRDLGDFELACEGYREVLEIREREFGVLVDLSETLVAMAWRYIETGYYSRAMNSVVECMTIAEKALQERSDAFNLWKTVGDACMLFSWVQNLAHKFPKEDVLRILQAGDFELSEFDIMADDDDVGQKTLEKMQAGEVDDITSALYCGILAYKRAIFATADDRHAHAVAWYNLGTAEYRTYISLKKREMKHRVASIRCFKRTIKLEPGNHEFWNALGLATAEINPKVAQHSIVRALYINDKVTPLTQIPLMLDTDDYRTQESGPTSELCTPSKKTTSSPTKPSHAPRVPIPSMLSPGSARVSSPASSAKLAKPKNSSNTPSKSPTNP